MKLTFKIIIFYLLQALKTPFSGLIVLSLKLPLEESSKDLLRSSSEPFDSTIFKLNTLTIYFIIIVILKLIWKLLFLMHYIKDGNLIKSYTNIDCLLILYIFYDCTGVPNRFRIVYGLFCCFKLTMFPIKSHKNQARNELITRVRQCIGFEFSNQFSSKAIDCNFLTPKNKQCRSSFDIH